MNIVLVEPEIPQNTGNISRTCAVTKSTLHLVRPLGFSTDNKRLKRAGLDYWHLMEIRYYDSFWQLREKFPDNKFFYATTKAQNSYADVQYNGNDFLVFGKETKGLPDEIIERFPQNCVRIPMADDARSMNLANAVSVILFEALRQNGYPGMR